MPDAMILARAEPARMPASTPVPGGDEAHAVSQLLMALYNGGCGCGCGCGCGGGPAWSGSLEAIRRYFDARQIVCIQRPGPGDAPTEVQICQPECAGEFERLFLERFAALDPFTNLPPDRACLVHDLIGERRWRDTEFYRGFLVPQHAEQVLGADLPLAADRVLSLRICRGRRSPPFAARHRDALQMLLPHVRQAAVLMTELARLADSHRLLAQTVERMDVGLVVLDVQQRVLSTNGPARHLLGEGGGLRIEHTRLRAADGASDRKLQSLVRKALEAHSLGRQAAAGVVGIACRQQGQPIGVAVDSLAGGDVPPGTPRAAVLLTIRAGNARQRICDRAACELFGLTPCETRLAVELAAGRSIDDAAQALAVSRNTVRTHLARLFQKTSTTRQAELVNVLVGGICAVR